MVHQLGAKVRLGGVLLDLLCVVVIWLLGNGTNCDEQKKTEDGADSFHGLGSIRNFWFELVWRAVGSLRGLRV
jgi:hypothetical protein